MFDVVAYTDDVPSVTTTALTIGTLVTRVGRLLRRDDLDVEIQYWLDFSMRELCDRVNFPELRETTPINLVSGTYRYDLPNDYNKMDRAYYKDTTASPVWGRNVWPLPRDFYSQAEIERRTNAGSQSTGDPLYYIIDGEEVIFYPVPNKAATVELTYYKLPTAFIDTGDEPDINEQYRHYLIWMAYFWGQVFLEKQDTNKVALAQQKFERVINDVKKIVSRKENKSLQWQQPTTGTEGASRIYGT